MRLKGASPNGPVCSACQARNRTGPCDSCGRVAILVGRNPDGQPWCSRCYAAAAATDLAGRRRKIVLAAVAMVEPFLAADVICGAIDAAGTHRLRALTGHLAAHPDALSSGPNSEPPVLGRFVRTLVAAGAQRISLIHPACLDCRRRRPAQQRFPDGVLCGACHARRSSVKVCAACGTRRRVGCHDAAGNPICRPCLGGARVRAERAARVEALSIALSVRTHLDTATLTPVLTALGRRPRYLAALAEQLAHHDLADTELSFELARLVIALRTAGADLPAPACHSCGQPTGEGLSTTGGRIRCRACVQLCPDCGRSRRSDGENVCRQCRKERHLNRGTCTECNQTNRIRDNDDLCHNCAHREDSPRCADCGQVCPTRSRTGPDRICKSCALRRAVDQLLPAGDIGGLEQLRAAILTAEPLTTTRFITRPAIAALLTDLRTSQLPPTHATLQAQPASASLEYLRALLVAAGALPDDPTRPITGFEQDAQRMLAVLTPQHARLLRSWLRWKVQPRLRRHIDGPPHHIDGPPDLVQAVANARRTLGQVIAFVRTLEHAETTLQGCRQHHIDDWFATPIAIRHQVRPFLTWMQQTRHLPPDLTLPPTYRGRPQPRTDAEQRWNIARRLVTDDTLDAADRVAGALVVLYAQTLSRIVTLTTEHIQRDADTVSLQLGTDRLELAEPFATLIQSLPLRRRHGIVEQLPTTWLFPGQRAGRPLRAVALGNRLRDLGIQPQGMRLAALDQLTKEVPPAMLAGVLGIPVRTAVGTTSRSGGDWTRYAAGRRT